MYLGNIHCKSNTFSIQIKHVADRAAYVQEDLNNSCFLFLALKIRRCIPRENKNRKDDEKVHGVWNHKICSSAPS
jgi:hypothetical protein